LNLIPWRVGTFENIPFKWHRYYVNELYMDVYLKFVHMYHNFEHLVDVPPDPDPLILNNLLLYACSKPP